MIGLSPTELAQLGTQRGDIPFLPDEQSWQRFRAQLVEKSAKRNHDCFDPSLAAYTPGETLGLLDEPRIAAWLNHVPDFTVPEDCVGAILVPCAASKPWRDHKNVNKSRLYSAYNQLLDEMEAGQRPKWYFLTVSEPLGLVPQDRWGDFPPYDNPGLFKDDFLRTGLVKSDWTKTFLGARHRLPFDQAAFEVCIERLGTQIGAFLAKQNKPIVSFVDDAVLTTHGAMLDVALQQGGKVLRLQKRAAARQNPFEHISRALERFSPAPAPRLGRRKI